MKKLFIYASICLTQFCFAQTQEWSDDGNEPHIVRSAAARAQETTGTILDSYKSMPRSIICYVDRGLREQEVIRVVIMDGGGIRGTDHPIFLCALAKRTGIPINHMFHYAVGTSAGGIGAVGLQHHSPEELLKILVGQRKKIFDRRLLSYFGITSNRYNSPTPVFKEVFGDEDFRIDDEDDLRCMVTGHNMGTGETILVKNYEAPYFKSYDAASITSAAPIYFPAHTCKDLSGQEHTFIDGGVGANDPTLIALNDIQSAHPNAKLVIFSIGTGQSIAAKAKTAKDLAGAGAIDWIFQHGLLDILMGAPNRLVQREIAERFNPAKADSLEGIYARINPGLNPENQSMDNTDRQNVNALILATLQELAYPSGQQFILDLQREGQTRAVLTSLAAQQELPSTQFVGLALDALKQVDVFPGPFQKLVRALSTPKKPFSQMRVE